MAANYANAGVQTGVARFSLSPVVMLPRDIQPDRTHLVHRRVAKGNERLRQCAETRAILTYALFEAAVWFGMDVHSAAFLDGEYFLSVNDPHGLLPLFMQRFNHNTAMSLKAVHSIDGVFWEPGRSYDDTVLDNREDILRALAFVDSARRSDPQRLQGRMLRNGWGLSDLIGTIERPARFRGTGNGPVVAKLAVPEALAVTEVTVLKKQIEEAARGFRWPRRQTRKQRRANRERGKLRDAPKFRLTLAAQCRSFQLHDRFQRAYRKAWKQLRRGITRLFPWGTWWLAFHAIVRTTAG